MPFPLALHGQQGDIAIGVSAARKAEAILIFPQRQLDGELSKRHPSPRSHLFILVGCSTDIKKSTSRVPTGGGGGQQNRASDSSSCERMRSACLHFV